MNGIEPTGAIVSYGVLFSIKVTLLLGIGFLASISFRKASASLRHLLWSATFVALLVLPIPAGLALLANGLRIPIPLAPASVESSPSAIPDADTPAAPVVGMSAPSDATSASSGEPRRRRALSWSTVAVLVWLGGFAVLVGRLVAGIVASIREVLRAKEANHGEWSELLEAACDRLEVSEEVSLRTSHRNRLPMTIGLFYPTILLPVSAQTYAAPRRWAVLLHELAHVRRRDCLTLFLAQIVSALYWWNPLVWLAARDMRLLSERASDDLVLGTGASPADYAHDLLEMARGLHEERFTPLASVAMAHRSRFEERLLAILDPAVARRAVSTRWAFGASTFALPVLIFVALAVPTRASRLEPEEASTGTEAVVTSEGQSIQRSTAESEDPAPEPEAAPAPRAEPQSAPVPEEQKSKSKSKSKPTVSPEARDKARAALAEALDDPDASVQKEALHALVQMGDASVAPHLAHALESGDAETRAEAAWGLGQLRDDSSVASLQKALSDDNAEVREQAAWALGMIRSPSAVDGLVAALSDAEENVREQAAWALGMIRDPRAVAALSNAIVDRDANVRSQAVWALGMMRSKDSFDALVKALSDETADVREQAAWALGMLHDSRAIEALSRALKDEDSDVREQAAWALGVLANGEGDEPDPPVDSHREHDPSDFPGKVL